MGRGATVCRRRRDSHANQIPVSVHDATERRRLREIPCANSAVKGGTEQLLRRSSAAIAATGGRQQLDILEPAAVAAQGLNHAPRAQVPKLDGVLNGRVEFDIKR